MSDVVVLENQNVASTRSMYFMFKLLLSKLALSLVMDGVWLIQNSVILKTQKVRDVRLHLEGHAEPNCHFALLL